MEFASLCVWRTHCKQRNSLISKTISAIKKIQYCEVKVPERRPPQPRKAFLRDDTVGKANPTEEKDGNWLELAYVCQGQESSLEGLKGNMLHTHWIRDPARILS